MLDNEGGEGFFFDFLDLSPGYIADCEGSKSFHVLLTLFLIDFPSRVVLWSCCPFGCLFLWSFLFFDCATRAYR